MITPLTAGVTLVVALLVFGPKNLPELAKGAGKALNEFKKAVNATDPPAIPTATPIEAPAAAAQAPVETVPAPILAAAGAAPQPMTPSVPV
jgi:sec-independent protein translocase protein TatA